MAQISLRISDELAEDIKADAKARKLSVNGYITHILRSASDPEFGGSEGERVRERLRRAGLLEEWLDEPEVERPDPKEIARIRAKAGKGTSLSDLVIEERRR
ncbi:MAG TPA: hypothetical protein PLO12_07040 [Solirubrobacterales bacterium]|nr:hypothetical protein [Solirubrobacterales bacterium]